MDARAVLKPLRPALASRRPRDRTGIAPADHVTITRYEEKKLGDCAPVFLDFVIGLSTTGAFLKGFAAITAGPAPLGWRRRHPRARGGFPFEASRSSLVGLVVVA
jgi:hypothetical protein